MKKLVLTSVCALAMAGAAFAQGTLQWNLFSPASITVRTNAIIYSPLFGGGTANAAGTIGNTFAGSTGNQYYFELLYFTTANLTGTQLSGASAPSNSFAALFGGGWADTGGLATNSASAGIVGDPSNPALTVNGMNPGTTNNIILVGWSANLGTSWATVSNELATGSYIGVLGNEEGFFGVSTAGFLQPLATTTSPGSTVFGTAHTGQGLPIAGVGTTLYLLPVPEPATLALAGLGGLSLMLFRRQRK